MLKKLIFFVEEFSFKPRALILILSSLFVPEIMGGNISLDGTLTPGEWDEAISFDLEYELMPSRNAPAALKTTAYVKYDKKYLYIGIKCYYE